MPGFDEVSKRIDSAALTIRKEQLERISRKTGRHVISYYSSWLSAPQNAPQLGINDFDLNGFMSMFHQLDSPQTTGVDFILHTPGGEINATEAIVNYIRSMCGNDYRVIVPQIAMSAGTMIACSAKEIVMGKQSSLGPIDPQINGLPAQALVEEFNNAVEEMKKEPAAQLAWSHVLSKYHPTLITSCNNAISMSQDIVGKWLKSNMFDGDEKSTEKAQNIVAYLSEHSDRKSHGRHIGIKECQEIGLAAVELESDQDLQDAVLTLHHTYMHACNAGPISKIIENSSGKSFEIGYSRAG